MFQVALWQIQHCLFANPIWLGDCLGDIESSCVWIWHTARLLVAFPHLLLAYAQSSGAKESPGHISSRLSLHNCQSQSAINTVDTIIEFLCQNLRHGLTYLWQSWSLCRKIIVVRAHLGSASQSVGDWDTARVFMAKLHLSLLGMSWVVLAMGPKSRFGSGSGSNPQPDRCNGFPLKTRSSKVNISCCNSVLEFSSYRNIIYTWNMQFDALLRLPVSDLQSYQFSWRRDGNPVILTCFSA